MPAQSTTRLVAGDPFRSLFYGWSLSGDLTGPYRFTGPKGEVPVTWLRLPRSSEGWKDAFQIGLTIPDDTPPGEYVVEAGGATRWAVTVETAGPSLMPWQRLNPFASSQTIAGLLWAGYAVDLAPGLYEWDAAVTLPDNCHVRGYGVHIIRRDNGDPNDYRQRMFFGGRNVTLEGLTLYPCDRLPGGADRGGCGVVFHAGKWSGSPGQDDNADPDSHTGTGFVLKNCTVVGGNLGNTLRGVRIEDCVFDRCSCNQAGSGLWLRNRHRGLCGLGEAWRMVHGSAGATAVIDADFDDTDRGLCFDVNGPFTDNLIHGLGAFTRRTINGCEVLAVESSTGTGEFSRNLVFNTRGNGLGVFPLFGAEAHDNLFQDFFAAGPGGAVLWGMHPQTGNRFLDGEWEGPLQIGPQAKGNLFQRCAWRWAGPSRANQGGEALGYYDVAACVTDGGTGNRLDQPRFYLPDGLKPTIGVAVTGGKVNNEQMADVATPVSE